MPHLEAKPDLAALQEYVRKLEAERGFSGNTIQQEALLLGEEIGELFKAIRKQQGSPWTGSPSSAALMRNSPTC